MRYFDSRAVGSTSYIRVFHHFLQRFSSFEFGILSDVMDLPLKRIDRNNFVGIMNEMLLRL